VSFSQISSQATDKLLGDLGDDILVNYIAATELANRMKPDASLIQYLSQLSSQSAAVTSYVRKVISVQDLYEKGVANFSSEIVRYDMAALSSTLANFVSSIQRMISILTGV
jgi:activator of HSP90 ATPase